MMSFRATFLPSFVLGLSLALVPAHHAEAKETQTAKTSKVVKNTKAKVVANKKEDSKKTAKKSSKKTAEKITKTSKQSKAKLASTKNQKSSKTLAKNTSKTKEQRLAERKERTRERLAKVSRTGKVAKVAKYAAKPIAVAAISSAVIAPSSATAIEQTKNLAKTLNLESKSALIMNTDTGEILYGKNIDQAIPIASITKLMTAMVVLDAKLPLDEAITITDDDVDRVKNSSSRVQVGSVLSRAELMLLALMSSENRAAHALARTYSGGESAAIAAMNRKAASLGMTQTRFEDGTGLNSHNIASPKDLVTMVKTASTYPLIRRFSTTGGHAVAIRNSIQNFNNTNALVKSDDWEIGVSKTGYISEAGKCLVMQAKIKSTPVAIVLMDSWGKYTRIGDAQRVKSWLESSSSH